MIEFRKFDFEQKRFHKKTHIPKMDFDEKFISKNSKILMKICVIFDTLFYKLWILEKIGQRYRYWKDSKCKLVKGAWDCFVKSVLNLISSLGMSPFLW